MQNASSPPAGAPIAAQRRRVLVVDDHRDATRILSLLLESLGHEVRSAHDAREAFEQAKAFGPEIVLCDIGLPGTDGYAVARQLRASPGGAQLRLIALTGWGHDEDRKRSREAGFDHHLVKPVTSSTLRDLIGLAR